MYGSIQEGNCSKFYVLYFMILLSMTKDVVFCI